MKILLKLLPKRFLSYITGILADLKFPKWFLRLFLRFFIKVFRVNMEEAKYPISHYNNVNEFFTRPLKDNVRPIDPDPNILTSPVDGVVIEFGKIDNDLALQVKGFPFTIKELIKNEEYCQKFFNGYFITLYLSPKDYHRIHTAHSGKAIATEYNRGLLYPVNSLGLHSIKNLFAVNERQTTFFESSFGTTALIKVAAVNVGRIKTVYPFPFTNKDLKKEKTIFHKLNNLPFNKGDELARFEMGSTVVLLFQKGSISFFDQLSSGDFLKMGEGFAKSIDD